LTFTKKEAYYIEGVRRGEMNYFLRQGKARPFPLQKGEYVGEKRIVGGKVASNQFGGS